ncbi:MAG: hypothetical protein ACRD51_14385 [Candidatus Acidiferrum sp.]
MKIKSLLAAFLFCFFFLPAPSFGQCRDRLCQSLQNILYAAVTDFRGYRENLVASPDVSITGARIPCRTTLWANNVPMYMCYGEVPDSFAENWYINTLASARILQPAWQFKIKSPNADHFVDAGPPDCQVPDTGGPYIGHCPLHFQVTKQNDGMSKVYLWMSSLSSPYLVNRPPSAPAKHASSGTPVDCGDLCQGLKSAFSARLSDFAEISPAKTNGGGTSGATLRLSGADDCRVDSAARPHSNEVGKQYVCYWPEDSVTSAEIQFRDLVSRVRLLAPPKWTARAGAHSEQLTGAKVTEWCTAAPGGRQQACVDLLGQSVGLHIRVWN